MKAKRLAHGAAIAAVAALMTAACTSGDTGGDDAATTTTAATGDTAPVATGPSPGVTDDTVLPFAPHGHLSH